MFVRHIKVCGLNNFPLAAGNKLTNMHMLYSVGGGSLSYRGRRVSGSYQIYENVALSNQLTDGGRGEGSVSGLIGIIFICREVHSNMYSVIMSLHKPVIP
jgi:hypothetical protein